MNRTPKVAAVQDLSGLGRCSLSVVLPVLSVMGAQCCPLPTAVLSAHTAFPAPEAAAFQDLTGAMEQTLRHWEALHTSFDAIYSGFLGSPQQIGVLPVSSSASAGRRPWSSSTPSWGTTAGSTAPTPPRCVSR